MTADWRNTRPADADADAPIRRFFDTLAKTVSVDFDGVVHPYTDGWCGSKPADEPPTEGALEFLQALKERGLKVVISSCRADHAEGLAGIWNWLAEHGLRRYVDDVTHIKPPAVAYFDDRAVALRPAGDPSEFQRALLSLDALAAGRSVGAAS